jgi:hypothetical protein
MKVGDDDDDNHDECAPRATVLTSAMLCTVVFFLQRWPQYVRYQNSTLPAREWWEGRHDSDGENAQGWGEPGLRRSAHLPGTAGLLGSIKFSSNQQFGDCSLRGNQLAGRARQLVAWLLSTWALGAP